MIVFEETLDPSETKDFVFDWSPQLGEGENVDSHTVTFIAAAGTTSPSNSVASPLSRVWLTGGTHGEQAIFTIRAVTSGGRTLEAALAVNVVDSLIGPDLAAMSLETLKQDRADVWAAMIGAAKGDRIKEVWRDGRRVVNDTWSYQQCKDMLAMIDAEIARQEEALGATPSRPRRGAIGIRYA